MICIWQMLIRIFSRAKQHQLREGSKIPPPLGQALQNEALKKRKEKWACHQGGRQRQYFISAIWNTDFLFSGCDWQRCSSPVVRVTFHFNSSFTPSFTLGQAHQASSLPRTSSFAGASQWHISAGDPLFCLGRAVPVVLSVYTDPFIWFPSSLRGATGSGFFRLFKKLLLDTFQQVSPVPPIVLPPLHTVCPFNKAWCAAGPHTWI